MELGEKVPEPKLERSQIAPRSWMRPTRNPSTTVKIRKVSEVSMRSSWDTDLTIQVTRECLKIPVEAMCHAKVTIIFRSRKSFEVIECRLDTLT